MGIEGVMQGLDINKFMAYMMDIFWFIVKYPFQLWNSLPDIVHYIVFGIIFLIAVLLGWVTLRYRDAWRYFG